MGSPKTEKRKRRRFDKRSRELYGEKPVTKEMATELTHELKQLWCEPKEVKK